ncbi:hypothetical protein GVN24_34330 [Rhizobium sp. CRIBSB]|nr:hypothetical protein [Rhizobium sp. CRIBSB]
MSADEFDPAIERLFSQSPSMADASLFEAGVEARLASSGRVRTLALSVAGLIGGLVAVRETMNINLNLAGGEGPVAGRALGQALNAATVTVQGAVQSGLDQMGMSGLELGSMGSVQLFWITAGALIALAAAGLVTLSQEA